MPDERKVGFRVPPAHGKIKPGEKRSPGRPKGSRNKTTIAERFLRIAEEAVSVTEGGKSVRRSSAEVVFKKLRNLALTKDDARILERFLDRYVELEQMASATKTTGYPFTDLDKQVMDEMYRRMKLCEEIDGD
jgi:Family of unknown function (DUF5681)